MSVGTEVGAPSGVSSGLFVLLLWMQGGTVSVGTVRTEVEVPSGVSSGWVGGCVDTQAGRYCGYRS